MRVPYKLAGVKQENTPDPFPHGLRQRPELVVVAGHAVLRSKAVCIAQRQVECEHEAARGDQVVVILFLGRIVTQA